jgi:hypothetical protein
MFEPMLAVCPSFTATWAEFCAEWAMEPEGLPLYIALGELARHLVDRLRSGVTEEFPAVFQVVERWHCEGDDYVREAATIGLLEGIQNNAGHAGIYPGVFERWLLPESKKWWDKLDRFWEGDTRALREE